MKVKTFNQRVFFQLNYLFIQKRYTTNGLFKVTAVGTTTQIKSLSCLPTSYTPIFHETIYVSYFSTGLKIHKRFMKGSNKIFNKIAKPSVPNSVGHTQPQKQLLKSHVEPSSNVDPTGIKSLATNENEDKTEEVNIIKATSPTKFNQIPNQHDTSEDLKTRYDIVKFTTGARNTDGTEIKPEIKNHLILRDKKQGVLIGALTSSNKYADKANLHPLSNVKYNNMYQELNDAKSGKPFMDDYGTIAGQYKPKVLVDNYGRTVPHPTPTTFKQNFITFPQVHHYDPRAVETDNKNPEYMQNVMHAKAVSQPVSKMGLLDQERGYISYKDKELELKTPNKEQISINIDEKDDT